MVKNNMGIKEYRATGGNSVLLKEYHRKSDSLAQWQINFSQYDAQTYAFDHIGSGNHGIFSSSEYYPQVGSYDFRYKSVECGKNDKVIVEFDTYPEKDSVLFKDKYGVTYPIKDRILTFTGVSKADTNFIYAYRGDQKIGKLFLNTYQKKTYKVVLVSVNGAKLPNTKQLKDYLNKVYKQCAVSFEDSTDAITINDLTSFSHGGSGVFAVYNDDQKKVLSAYDNNMQDNTYYLFFVDGVTDKKDGSGTSVSGYMPRGYNAGFIYDGGSERTIAHELGHGVAGLEHVFENSSNSGKTANLMDYASGEELWHFQWDQIQDPSRVWMKWNKAESEGESIITGSFSKVFSEKYYRYLNEMLQSPIFKSIYNYLDKSEYYVQIVEKDKDKLSKEELEHYKYFLGYFDRKQTDQTVLFYTVYAGEENRPYKLFLFNSSKKPLSQTAFTDGAPLLEEMFHAAHFFFLKKANKLDNSIFLSLTETEVEFIKAYCLYLMRKQKEKYSNTYSKFFDYYHFWLDQNGNEDEIITSFFDILSNAPSQLTKQEKLFFVA